jgi:hypothetical protein
MSSVDCNAEEINTFNESASMVPDPISNVPIDLTSARAFGDTSGRGFGGARSGVAAGAARVQLYGSARRGPRPGSARRSRLGRYTCRSRTRHLVTGQSEV